MKNSLKKVLMSLALACTTASFMLPTVKVSAATTAPNVTGIVANTYIGDAGRMVSSFQITVDDISKVSDLKASDFDITGNYNGIPLTLSSTVTPDYTDDGISLTTSGNIITMNVKPFKYQGAISFGGTTKNNFAVTCSKYSQLTFDASKVTKMTTRTVDDFTAGKFTGSNGITLQYRMYTSKKPGPQPLMVYLHGGGNDEVGTDNISQLTANRAAVSTIEDGRSNSVLSVQFPENYSYKIYSIPDQLKKMQDMFVTYKELIDNLVQTGKVDKDKIYLVGASSGGGGVFRFLMQYPDLFAGAIAISTKDTIGDYSQPEDIALPDFKEKLKGITNIPLWIVASKNDLICNSNESKYAYDALKSLGDTKVNLTLLSDDYMATLGLGGFLLHWAWVPVYNNYADTSVSNTGMMDWLFQQTKRTTPIAQIKGITANTYVGDAGRMVSSFEITVDDINKVKDIKASDFDITGNYDGYPLSPDGKLAQNNYTDDGIKLTITGNTIKIEVNPFKYFGGYITPGAVNCVKYPELSFDQSNITKVNTKTADDFASAKFTGSNGTSLNYRLYTSKSTTPQPLVVWLHGGGEVGSDNDVNITANRGATTWIEAGKDTSVLSVQFPANYGWAIYKNPTELPLMEKYNDVQYELIQKLIESGKVDKNRIYLVGPSSGGGGTFRFLMQYPKLFAGAIAIAAKDTIGDYSQPEAVAVGDFMDKLKGITDIPLWIVHAENDPTCDSRTSKYAYEALQKLGDTKVKLTIYDDAFMNSQKLYGGLRHWSWVPALNNTEMINWLFDQTKAPAQTGNNNGSTTTPQTGNTNGTTGTTPQTGNNNGTTVTTPQSGNNSTSTTTTAQTSTNSSSSSTLPKTGSVVDFSLMMLISSALVALGFVLLRRKATN
ncbi:LPXTG cell wall anchor domain-containing protein [Clostridium folliculivorans]|uniref:Phospholipase/carboxylesterase/thioesterase domain-containing protein n=1 Tax=Clostridium folliculivorans TaxID=2886038 RepID=A0A9W6DCC8_9CLOT|nr:LPXTG cell wall anchor domain-containing protein [Clostridium folliculivorans]GKU26613.1 hypothetical protein CFOLD11_34400 [Clostridium folliculivorans]GKU28955.1 hypothetical protein CFB3_10610 [Clostridium folliculivorans]